MWSRLHVRWGTHHMLPPLPGAPGLHVNSPKVEGNIRTRGKTKLQLPEIKCFVIFLEFHFNSNTTGANQNRRLGTYKNTILIFKTTEWMIYKVLILSASFSSTSCCFSSGITLKIVTFKLEASYLCRVFIHEKENWHCFSSVLFSQ